MIIDHLSIPVITVAGDEDDPIAESFEYLLPTERVTALYINRIINNPTAATLLINCSPQPAAYAGNYNVSHRR